MAKKDKENKETTPVEEVKETEEVKAEAAEETAAAPEAPETDPWEQKYNAERDAHLRLAADYDNYRKRTIKEKEQSYTNGKSDAVAKLLPVYDNLERALNQPTEDAAYKKGVEMTMTGLMTILESLGVTSFGQVGESFDPNFHNAVMQRDDENFGESTICEVFQTGFKVGEKVIRHAMVVVAN